MADVLKIDPEDLTIGDLEDFEDIVGMSFDDAMAPGPDGKPKVTTKALKALVFLSKRREDPTFTLDDARAIKVSELQVGSEEDPTAAAG
jgi:hypothetical protein